MDTYKTSLKWVNSGQRAVTPCFPLKICPASSCVAAFCHRFMDGGTTVVISELLNESCAAQCSCKVTDREMFSHLSNMGNLKYAPSTKACGV